MKEKIIKKLKKSAKDYEIFYQRSEIDEVQMEKNQVNFSNKVIDDGYGIRVHTKGIGFSASNVNWDSAIDRTIKNAVKSSQMVGKVKFRFPSQKEPRGVKIVDKNIKENGEEAIKDYAERLLNSIPPGVMISFGKVRAYDSFINVVNSEGLDLEREETNFMLELSIIVREKGRKMEFWPHEYRRRIGDLQLSNVERWIKIARHQLIAERPKTGRTTVIFSPETILDGLGSVIGFHSSGVAKVNGISKLSPRGEVASPNLTVVSDGLYPYGLMTSGFDDEGSPQMRNVLIKNGVFKGHVYDQFYSIKDEVESTGNGFRQSNTFFNFDNKYGSAPSNQISNFYVEPGKKSVDQLVSEVKRGILVESFSWLHPDVTTGIFSAEIRAGYYIRDGGIAQPIKGGLVFGNFFDLIKNVSGISDESSITSGGTILAGVCPYVRFEGVQVAGK